MGNVERMVEDAKFCSYGARDFKQQLDDAYETRAIKAALANRMFYYCRAHCLYDVDDPENKNWRWNDKNKCWREQKEGQYCWRLIHQPRGPHEFSEWNFVKQRS